MGGISREHAWGYADYTPETLTSVPHGPEGDVLPNVRISAATHTHNRGQIKVAQEVAFYDSPSISILEPLTPQHMMSPVD